MSLFCSPSSDAYTQVDCGVDQAGIIAVGIVDKSINPTDEQIQDPTFWDTMVLNGDAVIISGTRGEYLGAEVDESPGFALDAIQITGVKHTATSEFRGLKENGFGADPVIKDHKMALFMGSGSLLWVNSLVTSTFKMVIPKNKQSGAYWQGTHSWQDYQNPTGMDPLDEIVIIRPPVVVPPPGIDLVWLWESGTFVLWESGLTVDLE